MHLDMDAFFASVEQRDHPEYRGCPLVVGAQPGRRGVVATCSYEARGYGIRSAMPISEAYRRCPGAIYVRPDMRRYAAVSEQVMAVLSEISPVVEPVSIDEAYLDISGLERLFGPPEVIGRRVKALVYEEVRLSASVGIGPNRLIAKLASESQKPDGLTVVPPEKVLAFLAPMPVANLRGVGRQTQKCLDQLGIRSVGDLRLVPLPELQRRLGAKGGRHLYEQARGIASTLVEPPGRRHSISKETTFNEDVTDEAVLRDQLLCLAWEVGRMTRREGLQGAVVTLKIRFPGFETHTRQRRLDMPISSDLAIFQTGWELYQSSGFIGRPVRLIGIGLSGWEEGGQGQADLFTPLDHSRREQRLNTTLDRIAGRFGKGKLTRGMLRKKGRE